MLVMKQKSLDSIRDMIAKHDSVMLVGCNTCAAVCLAGGWKEVEALASSLRITNRQDGRTQEFETQVIQRQCEPEFVQALEVEGTAIVSLGCGAGVSLMSELLDVPVYPALDTMFIGAARGLASWRAECSACGECVLGETAGICPITRCAKSILNGPCGGAERGMCEVDATHPCAWVEIYDRLESTGRLGAMPDKLGPKDHSTRTSGRVLDLSEER